MSNSTTRTPATDMLFITPPTDELTTIILQPVVQQICHIAMPEPNVSTCEDVGMWQIFVRWWWICCTTSCRIVVSSSVGGVRLCCIQHVRSRCPCSGVWHLVAQVLFYCTKRNSPPSRVSVPIIVLLHNVSATDGEAHRVRSWSSTAICWGFTELTTTQQWRFYVGARGHRPPKSCPGPPNFWTQ